MQLWLWVLECLGVPEGLGVQVETLVNFVEKLEVQEAQNHIVPQHLQNLAENLQNFHIPLHQAVEGIADRPNLHRNPELGVEWMEGHFRLRKPDKLNESAESRRDPAERRKSCRRPNSPRWAAIHDWRRLAVGVQCLVPQANWPAPRD